MTHNESQHAPSERPCHGGYHRNNGRERRSSPPHGKHHNTTIPDTRNVPDHVYIKMLAEERARRASAETRHHGHANPAQKVKKDKSRSSVAPDSDQFVFQREDLEKMRVNRGLIFNMKSSICALSKFASELDKEITDVKTKQRATTSLWKDIKAKVKEMDHILCDGNCKDQCKINKKKSQGTAEGVPISTESHSQKLILPKLETGSRPNSTPSILEMQETLHRENMDNVHKSKVSNIKQIARKRSQEKALRDVDMEAAVSRNTSSEESVHSGIKLGGKINKQSMRKTLAERLRKMEQFQDKYILAGKETANGADAESAKDKGMEHKVTTCNYVRSVTSNGRRVKQNKGIPIRKF